MQTFNLDLSIKRIVPLLFVKQRDVGSKICIKLTDNKVEYVVQDDVTWSVWYSGASGEGNYDKIDDRDAVVVNGSTATVELIYQMLDNPGPGEMCLVMNSADGTQLGLWNIPYWVEAIPGADSKAATAYYQAFLQAQAKAEVAAERSEEAAARAEAGAGGTIIVSIDEGEVATHTAAEIYDAIQNHKTVVYRHDARLGSEFVSLKTATPSKAVFSKPGYPTEFDIFDIEINNSGTISYNTHFSSALVNQAVEKVETDLAPASYLPQTLTPEQKAQARGNIGAVTDYQFSPDITTEEITRGLSSHSMQGGAINGNILYYGMTNNNVNATIVKYDLSTNTEILSVVGAYGHAGDMTFNTATNKLIVIDGKSGLSNIYVLNPDTLELENTIQVPYKLGAIAFNPATNGYVLEVCENSSFWQDYWFILVDSDFKEISIHEPVKKGYLMQGIECDGKYIYAMYAYPNKIFVYDIGMRYVGYHNVDFNTESEFIAKYDEETFYISENTNKSIFKATRSYAWENNNTGGGGSADAVLYTHQDLTPEQQARARVNIGAASIVDGLSENAKSLLITILRNATYTIDQTENISTLARELHLPMVKIEDIAIGVSTSSKDTQFTIWGSSSKRATVVPVGQYLKNGKTYSFSLNGADGYYYGVQLLEAVSAGQTFEIIKGSDKNYTIAQKIHDTSWITNDYEYTPAVDNCIVLVNFAKKDQSDFTETDRETLLANFTIEEM